MLTFRCAAVSLAISLLLLTSLAALAEVTPSGPQSPASPAFCAWKTPTNALADRSLAEIGRATLPVNLSSPAVSSPLISSPLVACPSGCTYLDTTCAGCSRYGCTICDIYSCPDGSQVYCNCRGCRSPCAC